MKPTTWVVGSGGLLGRAVAQIFEEESFSHGKLPWHDPAALRAALRASARSFMNVAASGAGWQIFWCAGAGVVGSDAAALRQETETLAFFLGEIEAAQREVGGGQRGRLFFASSAGGVYGRCEDRPITEDSAVCPVSDYGREKLAQEQLVRGWTRRVEQASSVVGRIANLYGPGQRLSKSQGLVSHMSRCAIYGRPLHIFVPLDTSRDFIFVDDAASQSVASLAQAANSDGSSTTKIIASEVPTSIATLIAVFQKATRRRLKIVAGTHPLHAQQPMRHVFRTRVWRDVSRPARSLEEGIARVHRHQLSLFLAGLLSTP